MKVFLLFAIWLPIIVNVFYITSSKWKTNRIIRSAKSSNFPIIFGPCFYHVQILLLSHQIAEEVQSNCNYGVQIIAVILRLKQLILMILIYCPHRTLLICPSFPLWSYSIDYGRVKDYINCRWPLLSILSNCVWEILTNLWFAALEYAYLRGLCRGKCQHTYHSKFFGKV